MTRTIRRAGLPLLVAVAALALPAAASAAINATVTSGNLVVTGDASANSASIQQTGPTTFRVTDFIGPNVTGGAGCTPAGPTMMVTCTGVTGQINASGGDGNDQFTVSGDGLFSLSTTRTANLDGGSGDDYLGGSDGADRLTGGAGGDSLDGGAGNDEYSGGPGDDSLTESGPGDIDVLNGDAGNDLIIVSRKASGSGPISGGEGQDEIGFYIFNAAGDTFLPTNISLDDVANDGGAGGTTNVRSDVESVNTGGANDSVTGSAAANVIRTDVYAVSVGPGAPAYIPLPETGAASFNGGGYDTVDPGGGTDSVSTGAGNDSITATDSSGDAIDCGSNRGSTPDSDTASGDAADGFVNCESLTKPAAPAPAPPAAPAPAATPDTKRPTATIGGPSSITRRAFARNGVTIRLGADEAVSFAADLNAKVKRSGGKLAFAAAVGEVTLGSGKLARGTGTRSLRLKPSKRFAGAVRNKRLRLVIRVTATDAAGNVTVKSKSVRVK